tara:strand:- start:570 stop:923 length:354 start_codon:yes stop_codon:yes gene_type:complete
MERKDGIGYTVKGLTLVFFMFVYVAAMFFWSPYEEIGLLISVPVCFFAISMYSLIAGNALKDTKYIILAMGIIPPLIAYIVSSNAPYGTSIWFLRFMTGLLGFIVFKLVSKILYTED